MPAILRPVENGRQVVLDKAIMLIGRHPDCDVVLTNSRKVSRRHCCIVQVNGSLAVRDLDSMNGVRVNGTRIQKEAPLSIGDELTVGDVCYAIEAGEAKYSSPRKKDPEVEEHEPGEAASSPPPVSPRRPVDISQDFPVPLPDEEIPNLGDEDEPLDPADIFEESGADVSEESGIIMLEDSGEFEDPESEIEIIP